MKQRFSQSDPPPPWRQHNQFTLLVDGEQFFPAMLQAVGQAQYTILLEMYLMESGVIAGRFIDALLAAAQRGVKVRLLLDHFGSLRLNNADRNALQHHNIQLSYYNPLASRSYFKAIYRILWHNTGHDLHRNHRKLLLLDGEIAFVGGTGLTDEFCPTADTPRPWRETMIKIQGEVLADWQQLFRNTWQQCSDELLPPPITSPKIGTSPGRLSASAGSRDNAIQQNLLRQINAAQQRIWLTTPYFAPSWKIRRRLRAAARRGVDVRLLLPGHHTDHPPVRHAGHRHYTRLLRHGVRIFEYQPRFYHAKTVVCDQWCAIGSSNFDQWNLRWNLEATQEVDDPGFTAQVVEMLEQDFSQSIEYDYRMWCQRAWHLRVRERFWGWVANRLLRISNRLQQRKSK